MSTAACMLEPTPEIQPATTAATWAEIRAWLLGDRPVDWQRAAWNPFFHSEAGCQQFLNALLAGDAIPVDAVLSIAQEARNGQLWRTMAQDSRWNVTVLPGKAGFSEAATVLWWQQHGAADNPERVAQLTDLPATPVTDTQITNLMATLYTAAHPDQVRALNACNRKYLLVSKLVARLAEDAELPLTLFKTVVRFLPGAELVNWVDFAWFDDDASFESTRFVDLVMRAHIVSENWTRDAQPIIAQLQRMLAAGRVDIEALGSVDDLPSSGGEREMSLAHLLTPYSDATLQGYERALHFARARAASGAALPGFDTLREEYEGHINQRERLFHEEWLAGLLPETEYAAIKNLPHSMVRELYSAQWAAGYEGYRAAVAARAAAPAA